MSFRIATEDWVLRSSWIVDTLYVDPSGKTKRRSCIIHKDEQFETIGSTKDRKWEIVRHKNIINYLTVEFLNKVSRKI